MFVTSSPDLRFLDPFTAESPVLAFEDGGDDEEPKRNFRDGILGFFASSARRWQSWQMK